MQLYSLKVLAKFNKANTILIYLLLPVGGKYSLGLVVASKPVDPALNENQAELGILVLQRHISQAPHSN